MPLGSILPALDGVVGCRKFPVRVQWMAGHTCEATWTDWLESEDLEDHQGVSHASRVRYTLSTYPFVAAANRLHFGGRHGAHACFAGEQWRRLDTRYKEKQGGSWSNVSVVGPGSWRATGTPGLDYWYLYHSARMRTEARVDTQLQYKGTTFCPYIPNYEINGVFNRHVLD